MSNKTYTNPWAGLSSYQDPESADIQLKFCGRDNESFDVTRLIDDNIFVTLYGKSGTGKTSLLNAGVFPRLRQEQYLPVSIRLGMEAFDISFQQCILTKLSLALQSKGTQTTIEVVSMPANEQSTEYLWSYFARTRFTAADGSTLFPVLVFDQFEEVFRHRREEAETLLRQIHFMMDENHALSDRMVDGQLYQYDFNFRFVASIREDDLYRLEDSIDNCYLPELKRCRYRLRSLSEQGASDVILIPGEGLFKVEEQKDIVDKIVGKSRNEDGSISTNIISMLCSRIYEDYQRSGADHISPTLVDSFLKGNPFEQFYNEATSGFSNREKSYIEDHLVDSTGRRNSIPEGDFLRYVKRGAALMEGSQRILQRTNTSSDSNSYRIELIHDSFCEPLAQQKEKRRQMNRLRTILGAIAILFIVFATIWLYLLRIEKANEQMRENEILIAVSKSQNYVNQGDSYRARLSLLNILSNKTDYDCPIAVEAALRTATKYNTTVLKGHTDAVNYIAYNKDGSLLVSGSQDKTIKLWNVQTGECIKTFIGHNDWLDKVEFSPDEKQLYSLSQDGAMKVWNIETGEIAKNPHTELNDVDGFWLSPDKRHVILLRECAELYSLQPFRKIRSIPNSENWSQKIVWHPNSHMLFVYTTDDQLYKVDIKSGESKLLLKEFVKNIVIEMGIDHQGQNMALTMANIDHSSGITKIYNLETEKFDYILKDKDEWPSGVSYSPDDRTLITTSKNGDLRLWEANSGTCLNILRGHTFDSKCPTFNPDGKSLATCSDDNTIRIWDIRPEEDYAAIIYHDKSSFIRDISYNTNGDRFLSLNDSVSIYDIPTNKWQYALPACPVSVKIAAYSENDEILAVAYRNDSIYTWSHKKKIWERKLRNNSINIKKMSLTKDFDIMACYTVDGFFQIWDLQKEKLIKNFGKKPYTCSALSFSHDRRLLFQDCSDDTIRIWDTNKWTYHHSFHKPAHNKLIKISNDDKYMIMVSHNTISLIDINTGEIVRTFDGHTSTIYGLAQSRDGKYLVTTSHDCMVKIWDFGTGICLQSYKLGQLQAPTFNPQGNKICIGGRGELLLIDFPDIKQLINDTRERFKNLLQTKNS